MAALSLAILAVRTGIADPLHAAAAILAFATISIGIGALIGALVSGPKALLVMLVSPHAWATLLPGYGPRRMMVDGAFSSGVHAAGALVIAFGWTVALALTVGYVLRRAVGTRA